MLHPDACDMFENGCYLRRKRRFRDPNKTSKHMEYPMGSGEMANRKEIKSLSGLQKVPNTKEERSVNCELKVMEANREDSCSPTSTEQSHYSFSNYPPSIIKDQFNRSILAFFA